METGGTVPDELGLEVASAEEVERLARIAKNLVVETIEDLHRCKRHLREGNFAELNELEKTAGELTKTIKMLFLERDKIEKLIHGFVAGRRSPAMDLGDARAEVKRRMDSLRDAGNP